ncbi:MAG TPA: hypothetical protein VEB22_08330, partial [Phycisphaerales bacterium]|nr:hypothetical protein [Phycisphaerales bacterium]
KEKTVLQLPYGRIRFDVTSTKVANDVKIQTPDATLAVKGTHGVIEKLPGQPTRAYGGELNAGIVNVMYVGGVNVDVKKDQSSSGDHPQTAQGADADTFVQTGDEHSQDETSRQSAGWTPSVGGMDNGDGRSVAGRFMSKLFPPLPGPHGQNPIGGSNYVSLDNRFGGTVTLHSMDGSAGTTIGSGLAGFFGTPQGAALVNTSNGPAVVAIDDSAGPGYASGTMALRQWNPSQRRWTIMGTLAPLHVYVPGGEGGGHFIDSAYSLDGLGSLDGTLYASGVNPATGVFAGDTTGNFGIFSLTPPSLRGGAVYAQQVMSFPALAAGGGLTGANSRGTMFVAAQFNLTSGAVPGMVLLEVDPRTNFIANAWSVADGDFTAGSGGSVSTSFQPSGVAFVDGQVVLTGRTNNQTTTVTVRPTDSSNMFPVVTSTAYGPGAASNALGGEGGFNAAASFPITQAGHKVTPIPGVDPIWLATGYSRTAAASPTFRRMMRDTVLALAANSAECLPSGALNTALNNAIADHYNQTNGVNAALNQFYNSLPSNHPCNCNRARAFPGGG